jgi:hypothetical protein
MYRLKGQELNKLAHFVAGFVVVVVFENGQAGCGGVGKRLAASDHNRCDFETGDLA